MMSRRRALLINTAVNTSPKLYNVRIIGSLQIHQAVNTENYTSWYVGSGFTVDENNQLLTLINGSMYLLRYSNPNGFHYHLEERYCMLNSASGNTVYYFPEDSTSSYEYDEATGLYTITAHGRIQVFTPILTSTNNLEA